VLYELQVLSYYVAQFVMSEDGRRELKPPRVPKQEALDPLARREATKNRTDEKASTEDFLSASVAASMLRGAMKR